MKDFFLLLIENECKVQRVIFKFNEGKKRALELDLRLKMLQSELKAYKRTERFKSRKKIVEKAQQVDARLQTLQDKLNALKSKDELKKI